MSTLPKPAKANVGVRVESLRKSYGVVEVLKGIKLEVKPGEMFVIMGPSGSGKSVLLKHMIGLEEPDSGSILIDGENIAEEWVLEENHLAMVFQSGALLNSLTVEENVGLYMTEHRLMPPSEIKAKVETSLKQVGLAGKGRFYPGQLSGGMKKRVAIARAMVIEPQLMLYDEPTSELDPLIAVTVTDEIRRLHRRTNATSVVVTHDRDLAFGVADRMAILIGGEVLAIGTPDEVRASDNPQVIEFLTASFKPSKD